MDVYKKKNLSIAACGWTCGPAHYGQDKIKSCKTICQVGCCGAEGTCNSTCVSPLYGGAEYGYVAPCGVQNNDGII